MVRASSRVVGGALLLGAGLVANKCGCFTPAPHGVALRGTAPMLSDTYDRPLESIAGFETRLNDSVEPAQAVGSALRAALAVLAALAVAFVPMDGAEAARSGGRMGGMGGGGARRFSPPPPRPSASRGAVRSGPNINIGVSPMIGAPMYSPFGFSPFGGYGMFGRPMLPIPVPMGPSGTDQMLQNQQQRDEQVIDTQKQQIDQMQREIAELKTKRQ